MRSIASVLLVALTAGSSVAETDGKIPGVGLPPTKTLAKPGERVFTLNRDALDRYTKDPTTGNLTFRLFEMIEPGTATSKIKASNATEVIPNILIIPIPKGQTAQVGDIVIAPWAGTLHRGIVTEAKNPKQPTVLFVSLRYENPYKGPTKLPLAQEEHRLEPDTFYVLTKPFQVGSTMACKDNGYYKVWVITLVSGDKLYSLDHEFLAVKDKATCFALDQKPNVTVGDKVFTKWATGALIPTTVVKVDPRIGRVWVKDELSKAGERAIGYGDIATKLP